MSPRPRRASKPKRGKKVSYELIARDSHHGERIYPMLHQLVSAHHDELRDARIALAWCTSWKPDADGRVTLGKLRKAGDLDRDLAPYDFVVLLNKAFWVATEVTYQQRLALLDHELCHAGVKLDDKGEPARDERDRVVYRTVRHDLEEFRCIVTRHGLWKDDVELMAREMLKHAPQYTPCDECRESPGWVAGFRADGTPAVVRCSCWTEWMERHGNSAGEKPAVVTHEAVSGLLLLLILGAPITVVVGLLAGAFLLARQRFRAYRVGQELRQVERDAYLERQAGRRV